jgi:hypothetical protein
VIRPSLVAASLLLASTAFAADAAEPKMKASFIGEGGGYKHPDQATDQYMEGALGAPPNADAKSPAPAEKNVLPAPLPTQLKAAPLPASPKTGAPSRSISGRPPAAGRNAPVSGEARPAGRSSLWNGAVKPLEMKTAQAAAAESVDPAQAREDSDREYDERILGLKNGRSRPALGAANPGSAALAARGASVAAADAGGSKVFVSMEIDPREAGSLRDAVAGLGATTGFAADARFEAAAGPGGRTLISGWIPASRLGDAASRPGVKSLRVETRARPSSPRATAGEFIIGLRVDDAARARESADAGVRALTSEAGFRLTRVIGVETAPDGRSVAVVAGTLPISRLAKAMSLYEVATILPVGGEPPAPSASAGVPQASGLSGFMKFAAERGPWLIILTLLLALPSLRGPAVRLASVFNPYR